jgi:hypothetical protein
MHGRNKSDDAVTPTAHDGPGKVLHDVFLATLTLSWKMHMINESGDGVIPTANDGPENIRR